MNEGCLQNEIIAFVVANQVGADDVSVNILRHVDADHLAPKVPGAEDQVRRDNFVFDNALIVIDVEEKLIECGNALG